MCGLVGIAGDLGHSDEMFMKRLLLLDFFRGTDSTGMAAIRTNGATVLAKASVNPITLFDMKMFEKALNGYQSKAFIGHNRAATLGAVNDANAHPYQYGDITGAHNGTLDKASWQRLEHEAGVETSTDSAAVFASINEVGIDDTIKMMEKGRHYTTGAWALVWHDKTKGTINFIRNSHRPLYFGFNARRNKLVWASEWQMMNAAQQLTKKEDRFSWWTSEEGYSFFPFEEDHLYSIELSELVEGLTDTQFKNFKKRKIEGREPTPFVAPTPTPHRSGGAAPWEKKNSTGTTGQTTTSTASSNKEKGDLYDDDIADFVAGRSFRVQTQERSATDPLNGFITEERFNQLARYGCSYCGADIDIDDTGYTIYDSEDAILCSACSKHDNDNIKLYLPTAN